jgi:energy-coupling factor transporter ATP-binding protein EcfA2
MTNLIALAGPKGCGKSTVAHHVILESMRTSGDTTGGARHRFAGPIKKMLRALGLTEAQVDGAEKELPCALLGGQTPRFAMTQLGDWGRSIDLDLWVNATMLDVDANLVDWGFIEVIDDLRFDNEALAVRKRGGLIIQLERPGVSYTGEHASEIGISGHLIDHIVPNADTPIACAQHVLQLLRKHNP